MCRRALPCTLAALMCVAVSAAPAAAQSGRRPAGASIGPQAIVHGVVLDDRGEPLAGAVVSAFGSATVFAVSDTQGHFAFRKVPYGPYLLRAHLDGYVSARARLIQVDEASFTVTAIALTRRGVTPEETPVLAAGLAGDASVMTDDSDGHDHGEVAWRLRHLRRGVLKDVGVTAIENAANAGPSGDSFDRIGWALQRPAKLASFLSDIPWNGHIDLLTSISLDRPGLAALSNWPGSGSAFVAIEAPTSTGRWTMRGALTQGDMASMSLAAAFQRTPAPHRYEAGFAYGMQSYLGGHVGSRSGLFEGSRNVGSVYAYDDWTINPTISVGYGGKYARHDYLTDGGLFSPRASITITPSGDRTLTVRADVSRRAIAPGSEEFSPPASGLWLPGERTFSALSARRGFVAERVDHTELAVDRTVGSDLSVGVRLFRQHVNDQSITLFGTRPPGGTPTTLSHYYVASAGDFDTFGWGVAVNRNVGDRLRASVAYTLATSTWLGDSPHGRSLLTSLGLAPSIGDRERFHDVTTSMDAIVPVTETHVAMIYKVNSGLHRTEAAASTGTRFDLQLTQALPFLSFGSADVEMLMAVRSLFREDPLGGSVYDEILAIRPPKRIVGGVTVRF